MTDLLEIDDLVVKYRVGNLWDRLNPRRVSEVTVLAGVQIHLRQGETLGLIGESGSGKTTLGRAAVGLAPIHSGTISLDGNFVRGRSDRAWRDIRRQVGLMFQDPMAALDPRMTLGQSVTEQLVISGERSVPLATKARQLLQQVGLPAAFADRYPHEISGGQARRVTVARALAIGPKLVVADEPTAGLDLSVQGDLLNLLNSLQAELGLSYLFITHNLAVARHITDRIAIMYLGRIVETGPTARIFAAPRHPYTRALLNARKGGTRQQITGEVPSLRRRPMGCEFHTRCPLVQPKCRAERPLERATGTDHFVACHFPLGVELTAPEPIAAGGRPAVATDTQAMPPVRLKALPGERR